VGGPGIAFAFSGCPSVQLASQHNMVGATGWSTHLMVLLLFVALRVRGRRPCVGLFSG